MINSDQSECLYQYCVKPNNVQAISQSASSLFQDHVATTTRKVNKIKPISLLEYYHSFYMDICRNFSCPYESPKKSNSRKKNKVYFLFFLFLLNQIKVEF